MLQFLVTSKARRRLLSLLWGEALEATVAELAERADLAFATTHTELRAMQQAMLVVSARKAGREVFTANLDHPHAGTMKALVASDASVPLRDAPDDRTLRRQLRGLGAPLRGEQPVSVSAEMQLEVLLRGVDLARRDPVVARTIPLCVWHVRDSLDPRAFARLNATPEAKHALGFFLELTAQLGDDDRLRLMARMLRDQRMTSVRDFFRTTSPRRKPPASTSFPLAQQWGFNMATDLASFKALFDKFAGAPR